MGESEVKFVCRVNEAGTVAEYMECSSSRRRASVSGDTAFFIPNGVGGTKAFGTPVVSPLKASFGGDGGKSDGRGGGGLPTAFDIAE